MCVCVGGGGILQYATFNNFDGSKRDFLASRIPSFINIDLRISIDVLGHRLISESLFGTNNPHLFCRRKIICFKDFGSLYIININIPRIEQQKNMTLSTYCSVDSNRLSFKTLVISSSSKEVRSTISEDYSLSIKDGVSALISTDSFWWCNRWKRRRWWRARATSNWVPYIYPRELTFVWVWWFQWG